MVMVTVTLHHYHKNQKNGLNTHSFNEVDQLNPKKLYTTLPL